MKNALLALLILSSPTAAMAGSPLTDLIPDRVYLPLASHHTMPPETFGHERWQEINPGLILSWENRGPGSVFDIGLGVVRNSLGIVSPTVSLGVIGSISESFDLGVTGSLVYYGGSAKLQEGHIGNGVFLVPALQARYKSGFAQLIPSRDGAVGLVGLTFAIGGR